MFLPFIHIDDILSRDELVAKRFELSDYPMICSWWKAHGFPAMPLSSLPNTGAVIQYKNEGIAAGFLYLSNSDIAWAEWIVTNPSLGTIMRVRALDQLVEALCFIARENKCKIIFMALDKPKLIEFMKKRGFTEGDKNMTHLVKALV